MTETKKPKAEAVGWDIILAKLEALEKRIDGLERRIKRGARSGAAKFGQIKETPQPYCDHGIPNCPSCYLK